MIAHSPMGDIVVDPPALLKPYQDHVQFGEAVISNPALLSQVLAARARNSSGTLVLALDQFDAIFDSFDTNSPMRRATISAVAEILRAPMDCKVIIGLRTDKIGDLIDQLRGVLEPRSYRTHALRPLDAYSMCQSIIAPAAMGTTDSPFDHYRFYFQPELPRRIVQDVQSQVAASDALAVLQMICTRLYWHPSSSEQGDAPRELTNQQYLAIGSPAALLERHVIDSIANACRRTRQSSDSWVEEITKWCTIIGDFVTRHHTGHLMCATLSELHLEKRVTALKAHVSAAEVLAKLSAPQIGLLSKFSSSTSGPATTKYRLAHGVLARTVDAVSARAKEEAVAITRSDWRALRADLAELVIGSHRNVQRQNAAKVVAVALLVFGGMIASMAAWPIVGIAQLLAGAFLVWQGWIHRGSYERWQVMLTRVDYVEVKSMQDTARGLNQRIEPNVEEVAWNADTLTHAKDMERLAIVGLERVAETSLVHEEASHHDNS